MCLMCEYYIDLCKEPECVNLAKERGSWNLFGGKSITAALWRGYGVPCEHIKRANPDWEDDYEDDFPESIWP